MRQTMGTIVESRALAEGIHYLRVACPAVFEDEVLPGQFVHLKVPGETVHMLRRPISLMEIDARRKTLGLAIAPKGDGTRRICALRAGDTIDVFGPLGGAFRAGDAKLVYVVGGGVGVAPVRCALDAWAPHRVCEAFFGFRTARHAYALEGLAYEAPPAGGLSGAQPQTEAGAFCRAHIVTDDGSLGEHALVTVPLLRAIAAQKPDLMIACGPTPMLRAVQRIALEADIRCQLSLEERMACGIGACLVCACRISTADGWMHRRVCTDGPIFDAEEVQFDA